jgi:hypothetical protein
MKHTNHFQGLEALIQQAASGAPLFDETGSTVQRRGRRHRLSLGQRMALRLSTGRHPLAR